MVTIKKILIISAMLFGAMVYGEGSYELRGKSSSNDDVRIEGKKVGYTADVTIGLPRVTIFYVDIEDSSKEVIDIYSSNPNLDRNVTIDVAVWCPNNSPSNPESATSYTSADETFNIRRYRDGYIDSWNDVLSVQSISTRPRDPVTFIPSNNGCGDGVYTVRLYTHATNDSRSFTKGLEYMDIMVREISSVFNNDQLMRGRVFSKNYSLIQNGFTSKLNFKMYVVEGEDYGYEYNGFVWEIDSNGIQPFSFQLVANSTGAKIESQNDKSLSMSANPNPEMLDEYNIYLNYPDKTVTKPSSQPNVSNFFYNNICPADQDPDGYQTGGYFNFYSSGSWKYKLYIDVNNDGEVTLDEKVFQGFASSGLNRVYWDGILPNGRTVANGTLLKFNLYLSDGEVHFPWADVENRYSEVGPIITLKSSTTTDSKNYYWDDSLVGGTTALMEGTTIVRTWGDNLGDGALIDTWKYAYNYGLKKSVIYGGECENPDLGGNVSGYVFDDENHNSAKDYGEKGISNVTIVLHNKTNNDCETKKTDSNGFFLFDNILISNFDLVESADETLPISFKCPPDEKDPSGYISVDSNTKSVVFNELNASYLTFANYKGYTVKGNTFIDNGAGANLPFNGIKDGTEKDFTNVKIEAKQNGTIFETQYTNGNGEFEFWIPSTKPTITINPESKLDFMNVSSSLGNTSGTKQGFEQITLNGINQRYSGVGFGYIQEPSLSVSQTQTIQGGTTTNYSHKYKVNSIGSVNFTLTEQTNNPATNNSNAIIYEDKNCNGLIDVGTDSSGFSNKSVNVNTNNEVCLIIKVITQSTAPNNSSYSYSLNSTTNYENLPLSTLKSVKSITLITDSNSNLVLIKSVDKINAAPNEIITYEITIKNSGKNKIESIKVDDFTPAYTNFVSASCPSSLPITMTSCVLTTYPEVGKKGSVKWEFEGNLISGEKVKILYKVRVDN